MEVDDQAPQEPSDDASGVLEAVFVTVLETVTVLVLVVLPTTGAEGEDQADQLPSAPETGKTVTVIQ